MNPDRLSGLDSSFLHLERGPAHMHVASTTLFEGPAPAYDELREHIASRLHLVPRFRQKLRFVPFGQGRPKWVDDPQFNLGYHIRHTALPKPGSEEQLRTLAARIFSQRLDRSKPVWEMWLVDGVSEGRFAIVTKTHHCLVDGVSGVDITTVLFDTEPEPTAVPRPRAMDPPPRAQPGRALRRGDARAGDHPRRDGPRGPRDVPRPAPGGRRRRRRPRGRRRLRPHRRLGSRLPVQRPDRPVSPLRDRERGPRALQGGSRTSSAGRSTTSSSASSRARSAATCARAERPPRTSSCGRWSRSASAPATSTGRWATASPRSWRRCRSGPRTRSSGCGW